MKSLLNKLLAVGGIAVLMLSASCKKNDQIITATNGTPGQLSASATTLVLNSAKLTDPTIVETFTLVQPNFGYNAAIANTLQIDVASDNWANPYTVSLGADVFTQGYNTGDFNNILLKAGIKGNTTGQIVVRVKSSVSTTLFVYSNVLTLTVTPFNLTSWVYVPGAYEGWNNPGPQEDSLISVTGNGIYTGIINFTTGNNQFLITPAKNWTNKYATNDAASTAGTSSSYNAVYNGNNNYYAPAAAGQYQVTLNTINNTLTIVPAAYYSVIGDAALGWNTDIDLKYNNGTQLWNSIIPIALNTTGAFKFRKNHDWGISYGWPTSTASPTLTSSNGNNISVTAAGNYFITFGITTLDQTATYTATKQ